TSIAALWTDAARRRTARSEEIRRGAVCRRPARLGRWPARRWRPAPCPASCPWLTTPPARARVRGGADLNGDGALDLTPADENASVSVLLSNEDGSFQLPTHYALSNRDPFGMAAGDFNGDGSPELGVNNYSTSSVAVLLRAAD